MTDSDETNGKSDHDINRTSKADRRRARGRADPASATMPREKRSANARIEHAIQALYPLMPQEPNAVGSSRELKRRRLSVANPISSKNAA